MLQQLLHGLRGMGWLDCEAGDLECHERLYTVLLVVIGILVMIGLLCVPVFMFKLAVTLFKLIHWIISSLFNGGGSGSGTKRTLQQREASVYRNKRFGSRQGRGRDETVVAGDGVQVQSEPLTVSSESSSASSDWNTVRKRKSIDDSFFRQFDDSESSSHFPRPRTADWRRNDTEFGEDLYRRRNVFQSSFGGGYQQTVFRNDAAMFEEPTRQSSMYESWNSGYQEKRPKYLYDRPRMDTYSLGDYYKVEDRLGKLQL
jgi:hypothetical protein